MHSIILFNSLSANYNTLNNANVFNFDLHYFSIYLLFVNNVRSRYNRWYWDILCTRIIKLPVELLSIRIKALYVLKVSGGIELILQKRSS